jgi:hypothetical protein
MEDATALGFPSVSLSTVIQGKSWDASIYAGLLQFHQAKGFDPDSQDVARHLGEPLCQLAGEKDAPIAHSKYTIHANHADRLTVIYTSGCRGVLFRRR